MITPPPKGKLEWELGSRVAEALAREEETPGKGEPLEMTKVEIQAKEVQERLQVLIYLYSLKFYTIELTERC